MYILYTFIYGYIYIYAYICIYVCTHVNIKQSLNVWKILYFLNS